MSQIRLKSFLIKLSKYKQTVLTEDQVFINSFINFFIKL